MKKVNILLISLSLLLCIGQIQAKGKPGGVGGNACDREFEAEFRDRDDPSDGVVSDTLGSYVAFGGTGFRLDTNGGGKLERKNDTRFIFIDFSAAGVCEGYSAAGVWYDARADAGLAECRACSRCPGDGNADRPPAALPPGRTSHAAGGGGIRRGHDHLWFQHQLLAELGHAVPGGGLRQYLGGGPSYAGEPGDPRCHAGTGDRSQLHLHRLQQ